MKLLSIRIRLLLYIMPSKLPEGFTLIELLIIVIIIGILAAIAVPNLLEQVSKGRQAEAINNLGVINRAQQAYRYENGTFGTIGNGTNGTLDIKLDAQYYKYSDKLTPSSSSASYYANVVQKYTWELKDYSASVGLSDNNEFFGIICEAITAKPGTVGNSTNGTDCGSNSVPVQ